MPDLPAEREPSAARNIYIFGLTSFLNDTASEMAYWVLPAFLGSLGAGPVAADDTAYCGKCHAKEYAAWQKFVRDADALIAHDVLVGK